MQTTELTVATSQSLTLPWQECIVIPLGDLQLGSTGVDIDRFRRTIKWAKDQEAKGGPPVYFIGMGDEVDVMSPSNRAIWRRSELYDSVQQAMEDKATELEEQFLREVRGTEGRWLGCLTGHHFFEHADGTTSTTRIAERLRAPHLGHCAFVNLNFKHPTSNHKITCTIWAHHGKGSGIMPHAPLNALYRVLTHFEADIYLIGHMTRKAAVTTPRLYYANGKIVDRKKILAGTGGFSKGYMLNSRGVSGRLEGNYVEQGMMAPASLGSIVLRIRPVFGGRRTADRIDMNVEV